MRNFSVLLIQLVLAALVGYGAARFAVTNTGDVQSGLQAPVPQPPATASPAPAPPSPSGAPNGVVTTQTAAAALSISYRSAVQLAAPSVVTVYSARTATVGPLGLGGRRLLSQGLGSGVLIDAAGFVVTNNHVVQDATELAVALPDGTLRPTKVIGVDPDSDLALLKIDASGLRPIENFIQTDAAINPGNSGGALIDTAGRLVGINSAILSRGGGSEGIGFAIPIDIAQKVVQSLEKNGRVARGYLGVSTSAAARGEHGAMIVAVQPGGPADRAGMAAGDVIVRLGDRSVEQPEDLAGATMELEPGAKVPVELMREGRRATLQVQLGNRPPLRRSASAGR